MKRVIFSIMAALLVHACAAAAADGVVPIQTNFVSGATLSPSEFAEVVKLANLCGIAPVAEISTVRHLSGVTIEARSSEKIDGRKAVFETLMIHREGWEHRVRPNDPSRSIGQFWVQASVRPQQQERTVLRIADRTLLVGLLNGIKPEGADKTIDAFLKGRIRYASESVRHRVSGIDFSQPSWLGISSGDPWITFSSPLQRIIFKLSGDEVLILDLVQMYE